LDPAGEKKVGFVDPFAARVRKPSDLLDFLRMRPRTSREAPEIVDAKQVGGIQSGDPSA
jgi:hypothetical protein